MGVVKTDIRLTRERAQQIRFYPVPPLTATNVQDAIKAAAGGNAVIKTVTAAGPYSALPTDDVLIINQAVGAPFTVNVDWSARTKPLRVVDGKADALNNPIGITPAAGQSQLGVVDNTVFIMGNGGSIILTPLLNGTGAY